MVFDAGIAADLRRRYPEARIDAVRFGAADPLASAPASDARPVVFGACAPTAAIRRLDVILDAFATLPPAPPIRLHVLDPVVDLDGAAARLDAHELGDRVTLAPPARDPQALLAATDVCLCLSWPPAGETTPQWVRCLAAGKPTIVSARACPVDAPLLDPGRGDIAAALPTRASRSRWTPSTKSIRLRWPCAGSRPTPISAARWGALARRYREREHPHGPMEEDYRRAIRTAAATAAPDPDGLPAHLLPTAWITHGQLRRARARRSTFWSRPSAPDGVKGEDHVRAHRLPRGSGATEA